MHVGAINDSKDELELKHEEFMEECADGELEGERCTKKHALMKDDASGFGLGVGWVWVWVWVWV